MRNNQYHTIYDPFLTKNIFVVGDTHGLWHNLLDKIDDYEIRDCVLIHVGDVGIGFKSIEEQTDELAVVNDYFSDKGISFYAIAGNHDDPSYFRGQVNLSNVTLLPDYSQISINRKNFLFVGGAVSIDRMDRVPSQSWWEDEGFVLDESLAKKCDILITHTAPNWIGPIDKNGIAKYVERDANLWKECCAERLAMNRLIELTRPYRHFCGHFHCSESALNNKCISRILNMNEICEVYI